MATGSIVQAESRGARLMRRVPAFVGVVGYHEPHDHTSTLLQEVSGGP